MIQTQIQYGCSLKGYFINLLQKFFCILGVFKQEFLELIIFKKEDLNFLIFQRCIQQSQFKSQLFRIKNQIKAQSQKDSFFYLKIKRSHNEQLKQEQITLLIDKKRSKKQQYCLLFYIYFIQINKQLDRLFNLQQLINKTRKSFQIHHNTHKLTLSSKILKTTKTASQIIKMQALTAAKQSKKSSNIPLAVPRGGGLPINPFAGHSKKKSQSKKTFEQIPNFDEVKPQQTEENNHRLDTQNKELLYLDTEQAEILNTQSKEDDAMNHHVQKKQTLQNIIEDEDDGDNSVGGFEDGRKTKAYYARFLLIDQAVSSFSFLSIVIAVLEYDLEFEEKDEFTAKAMLWMTFILTLGMILLTIVRFQAKLEWLKTRKVISQKSNLITSGFFKWMFIEIVVSAVHPMPWTWQIRLSFFNEPTQGDAYYHLNEILLLIMLLRVLLIVRTLLMMSVWYNNRTQRVCSMYACEADYLFVIKCIMETQPYILITSAMVISIFYFGYMIRICEAPLYRNQQDGQLLFYSFWNCMWNIIVTMTTVGYGDYYARTHLGRFIIFFVCIWGVFIVSMMVITLSNTLNITTLEKKAIAVLQRLHLKGQMKHHAAHILTLLAKIGLANRKGKFEGQFKKQTQIRLRKALNEFKIAQRQYRSIGDENISEEMGRQFDFLREDLKEIQKKQNALLETNIQLMQHLKLDQQQIEYYAKNLTRSSFQQLIVPKDDKNMETSAAKNVQNGTPNIIVTQNSVAKQKIKNNIKSIDENMDEKEEAINVFQQD
ncbi:small-conductance calcium-activated potassium channel protein (macronuclear) [Tetrahymena thermophila SB210]|uniref:Small-conductance calcium-activated potassium channel protein n=1 Tax=Tetrahymena thermophila (strain SB210) TaxID=312017 RepID=Q22LW9_TETTS|nr:small-conductance calcium-activated potassium channel protein [Tetrahymena thermophila SB210]EAR86593.2 small-conductance calcium-activated potassium channel protein [Tetrahymena thermophila SB210]|eukprot:XP_977251.2 small-conductance calcium-activated potassium channel protein [Tetrahymena thermophila SB210]